MQARNVLLATNMQCKLSDFGFAKDLEDSTYYTSNGADIPVSI